MPDDLIIRPATPADVRQLGELFEALDQHHIRRRPAEFLDLTGPARTPAMIGEMIEAADSTVLVAAHGPDLIGLAQVFARTVAATIVSAEMAVAEVDSLVVRAERRREGVASRLMAACADWARARGLQRLDLKVRGFNAEALAFYLADGFEPAVIRMSKALA